MIPLQIPLTRKETISSLERQVNALAQEKNDSKKKHGDCWHRIVDAFIVATALDYLFASL